MSICMCMYSNIVYTCMNSYTYIYTRANIYIYIYTRFFGRSPRGLDPAQRLHTTGSRCHTHIKDAVTASDDAIWKQRMHLDAARAISATVLISLILSQRCTGCTGCMKTVSPRQWIHIDACECMGALPWFSDVGSVLCSNLHFANSSLMHFDFMESLGFPCAVRATLIHPDTS